MRPSNSHSDLIDGLQRADVLSRLSPEQIVGLARRCQIVRLATGQVLFQQGGTADAFFLLLKGQLKLYLTSPDGDEVIVDLLDPVATFGETRLFIEPSCFHVNCAALVDSEVVAIDTRAFLDVLAESAETCFLLLRRISERAERRVEDIGRLALQSGICRVASYLLAQLPPGRDEYLLRVPKGVLASRLGIRAETLSRVLKQLRARGIVSVTGQNVVRVHGREKLRRFVEEGEED